MANTHSLDLELGSSQYAYIDNGDQSGLGVTGDFTIEAWVRIETFGATNHAIVGKRNNDVAGARC